MAGEERRASAMILSKDVVDWVGVQSTACLACALQAYIGYKIEKNALDRSPGIEKEGRLKRRKAMGRYRL
ncbi:hypothetical protein HAX54_006519 [Datura stramonium]|uniref:Uncharacterized protein n=1 Tax=Datura stramonium TaxID=4076 RepID=A0ABS8RUE6_DATST|nr:hypothetical protein [Datura stramonium]